MGLEVRSIRSRAVCVCLESGQDVLSEPRGRLR